jgi:Uma2 family endonuclease
MIETGILSPDDRVELLDGMIVDMNPILAPHTFSVERTRKNLERIVAKGWIVRPQQPISLVGSEPEPDVVVARGADEDYVTRHPRPGEIALVVEVADTTLRRAREVKAAIYAAANLPEYWIVNLVDRQVEVYRHPQPSRDTSPAAYASCRALGQSENVPLELDGAWIGEIDVVQLLPPLMG